MMRKLTKKRLQIIGSWTIVVAALASLFFLPVHKAQADGKTMVDLAKETGDYSQLVYARNVIDASKICFDSNSTGADCGYVTFKRDGTIYDEYNSNLRKNADFTIGYGGVDAYSTLLGDGTDFSCNSLQPIKSYYQKFYKNTEDGVNKLFCGDNTLQGHGLFSINYYDTDGAYEITKNELIPARWPNLADNATGGLAADCVEARDKIGYYLDNSNATVSIPENSYGITVYVSPFNKRWTFGDDRGQSFGHGDYDNYDFEGKVKGITGNIREVDDRLDKEEKYVLLTEGYCGTNMNSGDGEQAMKYGEANIYRIMNPAGNKYIYINVPDKDKKVYTHKDLLASTNTDIKKKNRGTTCESIINEFEADASDVAVLNYQAKKTKAQSCIDAFEEDIKSFSDKVESVKRIERNLVSITEQGTVQKLENAITNGQVSGGMSMSSKIQNLNMYLDAVKNGVKTLNSTNGSIQQLASDAEILVTKMVAYVRAAKTQGNDAEKKDIEDGITVLKANIEIFHTDVIAKLDELVKNNSDMPTIEQFDYINTSTGKPVYKLAERVEGVYYLDKQTDTIICIADKSNNLNNEFGKISGATFEIKDRSMIVDEEIYDTTGGIAITPEKDACFNSDLESMAWVICPVANNLASTVDSTMNRLESLLATESKYYDNNSATFKFWEYCRSLANIALSIIILVVIFSQITGRGIDNYGIKKILPRLILMAILINLSFTICQLAIDASNILGQSLATMLKGIAKGMNGGVDVSINFSKFIATLSGGAILVGGAAIGGFVALAEVIDGGASGGQVLGYVIVILVLILLVMIVAIIVFFASLAVRIMIIVIFAGLSPLAFACYILPNTHNLFKKWWNIFKTALIIYPICGALYGFSFIVSKIAQDSDSFFMGCVGLVSTVLPYLVIPDLVKRSIAGLGVVGSKLSSVGSALKNTAGKIKNAGMNSERMKEVRDRGRMNAATNRAERVRRREESTMDGVRGRQRELLDKIENGETLSSNERRELRRLNNRSARYAKANDMYERRVNEGNTNNFNTTREATLGRIAQNRASQENKASDSQSYGDREQYYVETLANGQKRVWTKNSSTGQYEHVDKKGTLTKKTAADMRAMNGQFIGARETDVNKANISRAEQAGMRSSFANASSAAEAAQRATRTAQLSSMNTMREKIDVNEAKALGVQAAKEDEKFRQIRNEAERGYVAKSDLTQQLDIINRNNANVGANKAISRAYTDAGGDITKVAKSIESNQLATTSQINETIGANRAVTDAIMREGSITKVAKSIESGQLDAINRLNATTGANEAISKAIAKEGNISKVAKSIEANEQAQATQLSDTITGNRADVLAYQQAQADEKNRRVQREAEIGYEAKSDDALRVDALNRNNAAIGANQAIDEAIAREGNIMNVARSAEVGRQSQQAQIIQTIAGNKAAVNTAMNDAQIKNAIDTSAQKLENQFIVSAAENKVYADNLGDMKVNSANAENIAAKRIYTQAAENNIEVKAPNREAIFASATSKYNKELLEAEASRIKNSGTIDMDLYAKKLNDIFGNLNNMPADSAERAKTELTAKAYMKLMAEGGSYAQKLMANTIAENPKQSEFAAQFMSKDSDVSQALNKKNAAVAQFLRDVNSKQTVLVGNVETNVGDLSFDEWFNAEREIKDKNGNVVEKLKNSKFVEDKIVDKDESLLALSDGAFKALVAAGAVSKERMQQIYDNQNLFNTASKGVKNAILSSLGKPQVE